MYWTWVATDNVVVVVSSPFALQLHLAVPNFQKGQLFQIPFQNECNFTFPPQLLTHIISISVISNASYIWTLSTPPTNPHRPHHHHLIRSLWPFESIYEIEFGLCRAVFCNNHVIVPRLMPQPFICCAQCTHTTNRIMLPAVTYLCNNLVFSFVSSGMFTNATVFLSQPSSRALYPGTSALVIAGTAAAAALCWP